MNEKIGGKEVSAITGTGRSGTTLLIQIAAAMGKTELVGSFNDSAKGGYETRTDFYHISPDFIHPVIKDPRLIASAQDVYDRHPIRFKHVFLCVREFEQAAKSRIEKNMEFSSYGNLIESYGKTPLKKHIVFFQRAIGSFIEFVARHDIPLTILSFPRFALDPLYLHRKLNNTPLECQLLNLESIMEKLVDSSWIHKF